MISDISEEAHHDQWSERLAPCKPINQYRHADRGEDNADVRLKRQITTGKLVVAITDGKLA